MIPPTQAVVLCGGRGTRLGPLTDQIPKPMAPLLGRPFLEYLIEQLRDEGLDRILLLTGYRGDQIAEHFRRAERLHVSIHCEQGPPEWETGRRLAEARGRLDERFLLLYGDNLAPFRLEPLWQQHRDLGLPMTVTVARKEKGNIRLTADGRVEAYDPSREQPDLTHVEIGYMLAERDPIMAMDPGRGSFSLVLEQLARSNRLAAFDPGYFYHSISDPRRLHETEEYLRPRRLLLLDRDGVINRKAPRGGYVWRKEDFFWIPENLAALERLAAEGFQFIVLSNQAGIGRGMVEARAVEDLHVWMVLELRSRGISVLDVLICPHHWDAKCFCRKPRPGLFFEAGRKHRFRLDRTVYVGDDPRDVEAARNAGCPCLFLAPCDADTANQVIQPQRQASHLGEAVPWILDCFDAWESLVRTQ